MAPSETISETRGRVSSAGMEEETDTTYSFELLFLAHEADEAEANKRLAELLDEAEELGFELVWNQPAYH
jgi:hypothetical protein